MTHPPVHCHICKAPNAPFWFRPKGQRSRLPELWRDKYIRTCSSADCQTAALTRIARLAGGDLTIPPAPPKSAPPADPQPNQGTLL